MKMNAFPLQFIRFGNRNSEKKKINHLHFDLKKKRNKSRFQFFAIKRNSKQTKKQEKLIRKEVVLLGSLCAVS